MAQLNAMGRAVASPEFLNAPVGGDRASSENDVNNLAPRPTVPLVDRSQVDPQVLKAAQGMEAMFLDYMLKVMRQTVPKSELDLESSATKIYRSLMDSEIAQKAAETGGIGLADQIIAYLERARYNLPQGPNPYRRYK